MISYINYKYNRVLYILLGFYIILVFLFSLLLNGFFVNCKAYRGGFNAKITFSTYSDNPDKFPNGVVEYTLSGATTNNCIFYIPEDNPQYYYLIQKPYTIGYNYNVTVQNGFGWYGDQCFDRFNTNNTNYELNYNFTGDELWTFKITNHKSFNGSSGGTDFTYEITSKLSLDNFEYVTSLDDVKAYLYNNDDSVVKIGNPLDSEENVDSQIPTPQKVAVYKDSTSPCLVWSNPKGITNNENIKVRIEWKPVITLTNGLYDVHSIINQDYELLYYDNIGDYNSFCTLNNNSSPPPNVLNSYNTIYDSKVLFSGTGAQQSNDWANYYILKNNVDWVSRVDPFGTNDLFGKGTYSGVRVPDLKYRIRYETETGVSDWIYSDREFDSDNISGPSQHSSTHSRNASGDPVSNPTYTPNNDNKIIPQNEVDDQNDPDKKKSNSIFDFISGFFDTLISAISSIFDKLKELVDSISNGTGSFFSFFADLFGAFPQLLGIFLLGLVVTVLLRVLGR